MRPLTSKEINKRGCLYCLDHQKTKTEVGYKTTKMVHVCIHNFCPYRELDKYESYADYLKYHKDAGVEELVESVFRMQRDL